MGTNLIQSVFLYHAYNGEIFLSSIKTTVEGFEGNGQAIRCCQIMNNILPMQMLDIKKLKRNLISM